MEKRPAKRHQLTIDQHVEGVVARDVSVIGRTLTLMGSRHPAHQHRAREVIQRLLPHGGGAVRLGVSGVPGSGKSTFIETLGVQLADEGKRVAVLAVDPSSEVSGGSILGDKTRMERLSVHPNALVRPCPSGNWLGGVARGTRESMTVLEAAGYDVIMVETVGVGQSETHVARMVDFFLLLMIAGAGDELQGLKRGIMEMADGIAVNKADGDNIMAARTARTQYANALHFLQPASSGWTPPVGICSAIEGTGIGEIWNHVTAHRELLMASGELESKRRRQALYWLRNSVESEVVERFFRRDDVAARLPEIEREVLEGRLSPFAAAERLLASDGSGE